jgi:hypothetical protein
MEVKQEPCAWESKVRKSNRNRNKNKNRKSWRWRSNRSLGRAR